MYQQPLLVLPPSQRASTNTSRSQQVYSPQTTDMSTSTNVVSSISSRRTSAPSHKNTAKAQNNQPSKAKSEPDETPPKRPKRTLKLTASQRERKRAIDREAQRSIRLKTKNYIAHLENLVRVMEAGGNAMPNGEVLQRPHGSLSGEDDDERVRCLSSQLRQREEELRRLKESLSGDQKLMIPAPHQMNDLESRWTAYPNSTNGDSGCENPVLLHLGAQDYIEGCASVYSQSSDSSSTMVGRVHRSYHHRRITKPSTPEYPPTPIGMLSPATQEHDLYNDYRRPPPGSSRPDPPTSDPSTAPKAHEGDEIFALVEREINRVLAGDHQSCSNQPFDEDIIVRAVLHGWREVQDRYLLDLGWEALKTIDRSIFRDCGIVERMAILYMMRLKLLHQCKINPQFLAPLPPFFQRGPQENPELLKRRPAIEHFIWPGFRASICKDPQKYNTNKFCDAFRQSFKFLWAFDNSDAYSKDYATQLYSMTMEFKHRQWNLSSWTMRRDFFAHANELLEIIPVYDPPVNRRRVSTRYMRAHGSTRATSTPQQVSEHAAATNVGEAKTDQALMALRGLSSYPADSMHMRATPPPSTHPVTGAHVEAWLGDVPQYWNMSPAMNMGFEGPAQQWPFVQTGYVG